VTARVRASVGPGTSGFVPKRDLLEPRACSTHALQFILDLPGDEQRARPPLATEHLGASRLGLVDTQVTHGGIVSNHIREPVLMSPELDPGGSFVDTADEACGNEDEVLIRLTLHIHGDQLHVVRSQLRNHGRDPDMNHR
jgi:hypothetical protein